MLGILTALYGTLGKQRLMKQLLVVLISPLISWRYIYLSVIQVLINQVKNPENVQVVIS